MIVESVKIVADALADGTIGVNAQLKRLERHLYADHEPPPEVATIVTVHDDDRAAEEKDPVDWPALVVSVGQPWDYEGYPRSGAIHGENGGVGILYYTRAADRGKALRDGALTMRAVVWSLIDLFNPSRSGSESDRHENGIQLTALVDHRVGQSSAQLEKGAITATLETRFEARELLPELDE